MSTKVVIEVDTNALKRLVCEELSHKLNISINTQDVTIEVKASMNYKSEWEKGEFRATISKFV